MARRQSSNFKYTYGSLSSADDNKTEMMTLDTLSRGVDSEAVATGYPGNEEERVSTLAAVETCGNSITHPEVGKLGIVSLAVIVFYSVSGGPFGVEASVRTGGSFFTLLGFLIMPLVWSLPEAMMTAELSSALPEASGGVAWVEEAFGARAGWMSGYLSWVSGATDNAIYPILFLDYLLQVVKGDGDEANPVARFFLLSSISLILAYVNWMGLPLVGRMSIAICTVAMSPFIILSVIGAFKIKPSHWLEMPSNDLAALEEAADDDFGGGFFPYAALGGVLWRPFLNNLFWNLNSFDSAASFAGDVQDPGHIVPRAMFASVVMVVLGYFVPLLVALGASNASQEEWVDGYLARVATDVVGPWLGAWMVFAAAISNIGQFQAELSSDAFKLMGMAERGHIPKIFATRSQHGTPTYGIMLGAAVIVVMGVSDLGQLIEMLNFNYALALMMEYCAFIKLRIARPDLERPWKVPLNTTGCIIALIPAFFFLFLVLGLATFTTYAFSIGTNILGLAIFSTFQGRLARKDSSQSLSANSKAYSGYSRIKSGSKSPREQDTMEGNDSDSELTNL